jgi:hypothetical protein
MLLPAGIVRSLAHRPRFLAKVAFPCAEQDERSCRVKQWSQSRGMTVFRYLPIPLLLAACETSGTKEVSGGDNQAPAVQIIDPVGDELVLAVRQPVVVTARFSDDKTLPENINIRVLTDLEGELPTTVSIEEDAVGSLAVFNLADGLTIEGSHRLTVVAYDEAGQSAAGEIGITVEVNTAPVVTFESPTDDATFFLAETISVLATVSDPHEADPTNIELAWDENGVAFGIGDASPGPGGTVNFQLSNLDPATYTIGVRATDSLGLFTDETLTFHVVDDDADDDGFTEAEGDCNDLIAAIGPQAEEICNGVDDDCDGDVDLHAVDAPTWYADLDGDGLGNPSTDEVRCDPSPLGYEVNNGDDCDDSDNSVQLPEPFYPDEDEDGFGDDSESEQQLCPDDAHDQGLVGNDDDCDDDDAEINSLANEVCDEVDHDCDGDTNEGAAEGAVWWYVDGDGDGLGDEELATFSCGQPSAVHVIVAGDCDDADDLMEGEKRWYVDDDKDGLGTEDYVEACEAPSKKYSQDTGDCDDEDADVLGETTWYIDIDGDGFGVDTHTKEDCDEPAGFAPVDTDCNDAEYNDKPGADEYCDGRDNDCDLDIDEVDALDASTWYADVDGDGFGDASSSEVSCSQPVDFVADATDCDDLDAPDDHPGADEVCDGGKDNDCQPLTDEELMGVNRVTWWEDNDDAPDGYGDPETEAMGCTAPGDSVSNGDDCDDERGTTHPGADELCDDVDNNCNQVVDESPVNPTTWTMDRDADGHGDEVAPVTTSACDAPNGFVLVADDCDDYDKTSYPGHDEECDDVDHDCDDDHNPDAGPKLTWYHDDDGDGFGDPEDSVEDCGQPDDYVDDNTDCNDDEIDVNTSGEEVCNNGLDDDCDEGPNDCVLGGEYETNAMSIRITGGYRFGMSVRVGDLTNDDVDDIVMSSSTYDSDTGVITIHKGKSGITNSSQALADVTINGDAEGDALGGSLSLCDVNGDGNADLVTNDNNVGIVVYGPIADGTHDIGDIADVTFIQSETDRQLWCIGNIDNVKGSEVAMGAPYDDTAGYNSGAVHIAGGDDLSGEYNLSNAEERKAKYSNSGSQFFGRTAATLGDLNGDGMDEFWVSQNDMHIGDSGSVVIFGGGTVGDTTAGAAAISTVVGTGEYEIFNASGGDLTGNGEPDIVVGAPGAVQENGDAGRLSRFAWPLSPSETIDAAETVWDGPPISWFANQTFVGDVSGDGQDDLIVSGVMIDDGTGAIYVYYGPVTDGDVRTLDDTWDVKINGSNAGARLGGALAMGDVNDDGVQDIVMGEPHPWDNNTGQAGRIYVLFGLSY